MMKITYISCSSIPSIFANSVHVMKMCHSLANNGCDVNLICKKSDIDNIDPYEYYNCKRTFRIKSIATSRTRIFRVIKYLFFCIYNVIFSKGIIYARYTLPLFPLIFLRKKVILEFHNDIKKFDLIIARILLKQKKCICSVFITQKLLDYFVENKLVDINKAIVLSDACDIPEEANISLNNDIGYVGHLYEGRGIELIIEVAKQIADKKFHIIGGCEEEVSFWASKSTPNVIFHGAVPHSMLPKYYSLFSIALAPYQAKIYSGDKRCETSKYCSPMKLFEYMAYKKAIICSDLEILREVGEQNKDLLFVDHSNIQGWIDTIKMLTQNRIMSEQIAKNAYDTFNSNYTWDNRAKKLLTFISTKN